VIKPQGWPHTDVFMNTNSLVGELSGLIEYCYQNKVGVGGPDVLPPPHPGIQGDHIIMGTGPTAVRDYRGQAAIGYAVQMPEFCGKEGCFTPQQLYDWSLNGLGATHVFWVRMTTKFDTPTVKYSWDAGILPMLRRTGGRTNTACPAGLRQRRLRDELDSVLRPYHETGSAHGDGSVRNVFGDNGGAAAVHRNACDKPDPVTTLHSRFGRSCRARIDAMHSSTVIRFWR